MAEKIFYQLYFWVIFKKLPFTNFNNSPLQFLEIEEKIKLFIDLSLRQIGKIWNVPRLPETFLIMLNKIAPKHFR